MRSNATLARYRPKSIFLRIVVAVVVLSGLVVAAINLLSLSIVGVFAVMVFLSGLLMGNSGVVASLITIIALDVRGEVIDRHPRSLGHFFIAGAVSVIVYGVLGVLGCLLRKRLANMRSTRRISGPDQLLP